MDPYAEMVRDGYFRIPASGSVLRAHGFDLGGSRVSGASTAEWQSRARALKQVEVWLNALRDREGIQSGYTSLRVAWHKYTETCKCMELEA